MIINYETLYSPYIIIVNKQYVFKCKYLRALKYVMINRVTHIIISVW